MIFELGKFARKNGLQRKFELLLPREKQMLFYGDLPNLKLKFIGVCGYFAFFKRLFKFAFLGANFAVFGIKFSSFQLTLVSSCGFACISLADAPPLLF